MNRISIIVKTIVNAFERHSISHQYLYVMFYLILAKDSNNSVALWACSASAILTSDVLVVSSVAQELLEVGILLFAEVSAELFGVI